MSLILDALKRAERERRAGQAPQPLDPVAMPPPEAPAVGERRGLLVAGLIVLAALAVAAALWAWLHRPATAMTPATAAPAVETSKPSASPTSAVAPAPPAAAADPGRGTPAARANTAAVAEDGANTLDDLVDAPAGGKSAAPPGPAPAANAPAATAATAPAPASTRSSALDELPPFEQPVGPPSAQTPPAAPPEPLSPPPARAATPAAASVTPPATTGPATPPARSFRDMSPNYRTDFPALTVDVHVYNDDPQRRFVILNGRRYHEGDTLTEGPRIVAISDDGIVFDYRGERVLYPLPH